MNKFNPEQIAPTKQEEIVFGCLNDAIARFNSSSDQRLLLCPKCAEPSNRYEAAAAGERAIAHRLAFYVECELRNFGLVRDSSPVAVDCEYNRHIAAEKSLAAEAEEWIRKIVRQARRRQLDPDEDGFYVFSVAPDIVVHERRTDDNNLLAIEMKKRSNRETEKYDQLKLELFTTPKRDDKGYGYKLGAWIVAEDECAPQDRHLKIVKLYKDGAAIK